MNSELTNFLFLVLRPHNLNYLWQQIKQRALFSSFSSSVLVSFEKLDVRETIVALTASNCQSKRIKKKVSFHKKVL